MVENCVCVTERSKRFYFNRNYESEIATLDASNPDTLTTSIQTDHNNTPASGFAESAAAAAA